MATTSKKTTTSSTSKSKTSSYSPTSIKTLTSPSKTTSSSIVMPKVAPGQQTKVPQVTLPNIPAGPQSKIPSSTPSYTPTSIKTLTSKSPVTPAPQTKIPQVTMPTFPTGPQSKVPAPYKSTSIQTLTSGNKTSTKKSGGDSSDSSLYSYTPVSIQNLTSASSSRSSQTSSGTSTNVAGGGATGSEAVGSSGGGGASDGSVADKLESARQQLLDIQDKANKLGAKDESVATDAVVSDSEIVKQEKEAAKKLEDLMNPRDDGMDLLNSEIDRNQKLLREELSSIQAAYDVQKTDTQGKQTGEVGQTSVGIANAGGYLGFSGSGTGVMLKLAESHRAELTSLESKRQTALYEAKDAAAKRRFDIVSMKVDEIARIDQEKYARTQDYYNRVKENADVEKTKAERKQTENSIYEAIQGGAKTVEDIFNQLDGNVSIDEINKFLEGINPTDKDAFKFSGEATTSLLGVGMGKEDIRAFSDLVSEMGYTDEIRNQLTPQQRVAADKIFRAKATGTGTKYDFKVTQTDINDLANAGMSASDIQNIENSVNQFGIEATLSGIEDRTQRQLVADIFDAGTASESVNNTEDIQNSSVSEVVTNIMSKLKSNPDNFQKMKGKAHESGYNDWLWFGDAGDIENVLNSPDP